MLTSSSKKICFNSGCKDVLERPRKGWRRRHGDFADLCNRCASAYEEGKFCETFHLNASGWRCCESCGKQIHCGCIVSFHTFVLLDAGGIECINCAKKSFILTPNPAWPPPSLFLPAVPERIKDVSNKNWGQIAALGSVPWRQAPSLFSTSTAQSELHPKMPFEVDILSGSDRLIASEQLSSSSLEKKKIEDLSERSMNGSLKLGASAVVENMNAGTNHEEQSYACLNAPPQLSFSKNDNLSQQSSFSKNDPSTPHFSLAVNSASSNDRTKVSKTCAQKPTSPVPVGKEFFGHNGVDASGEKKIHNGKPQGEAGKRNQLLPRYRPRISDEELQLISGDSNSVITSLFEKILSASDAGRIGRLVLPKKCAEAYFPPISQPEGLPLKVQDSKGKEWIFQFRFWPNNNSRMYVLEGITPCIQSMQLQAGDIVTFSRLEPEGKLVMGFRKASTSLPSEQGKESVNNGNGVSARGGVSHRKTKPGETVSTHLQLKSNSVSPSFWSIDQANLADPASTSSKADKSGYIAKEVVTTKSSFRIKRKNSTLGSRSKRLRIKNEDLIELKLSWEEAQALLRPPPNRVPSVVVIEGCEFEEYEDAPIIGRPTIFATDILGEKIQWAQCEDCLKWRKVPADALLPLGWTCSKNSWDSKRSLCSASQELTAEQLEDLLPISNQGTNVTDGAPDASEKMKAAKLDPDPVEALEGLDKLANLAIQEEGEALASSSQATTKHPRHRPGCTCIVCIQPPSGKGPKHKLTCACNVCLTVKRRFRTMMLRREQKQSEKEAESAHEKQQLQMPEQIPDDDIQEYGNMGNSIPYWKNVANEDPSNERSWTKSSLSPFKGQIDLNIQPEREEELAPGSDSGSTMRLLQDNTERYLRQQRLSSSGDHRDSVCNQIQQGGIRGENFSNRITLDSSHQKDAGADHRVTSSMNPPASTSTTTER
ncbi:B3 domain-containing protein Os07g0563300-like isoform X2 [Cornus florida]|uniref:B3 domain-containing protein Os07g0563300-like isoform X2 n=1 Tax=Cornus florida TaxID=4283 RepID=UPI0028984B1B|nr:B3 domain-containing protein Os07g0563300-like isoform X2 [Cornus florida]